VAKPWRVWDGSWMAFGSLPADREDCQASAELQMLRSRMRRLKDPDNHCLIYIRVLLRRRDRDMPQQLLDGAQIPAFSQEVRGEAMPQRMGCSCLRKVERHPDPNHYVLHQPRWYVSKACLPNLRRHWLTGMEAAH
jgi:hypothetical protein